METELNLTVVLPPERRIRGADSHLYRIGLSLDKSSEGNHRNRFHNPLLVFYCATHLFIHQMIIILLPEGNQRFHVLVGDIGQLIGAKQPLAQSCALVGLLAMLSQIYNYVNHKNRVNSSYLNLFRMFSGLLPPKSLGISDPRSLSLLLKTSRRVLSLTGLVSRSVKYCIFLIIFLVLYTKASDDNFIIGLPYTILWPLLAQYSFNLIIYQFVYYYLLTYYLNLKLQCQNRYLKTMRIMGKNRFSRKKSLVHHMSVVLRESHRLYLEINEYNTNYWSKFLGTLWLLISLEISSMTYLTLYGNIILILRILFGFITILFLFILIFVIRISSIVYNEANKSYSLLNSINISLDWQSLIERVGQARIGFYCWNFFIINNFRGYEILVLTALTFMRIIETFRNNQLAQIISKLN